MIDRAARHVLPFVALGVATVTSCVWTTGNPEIVAPSVQGTAAPPPPPPDIAWAARIAPTPKQAEGLDALRAASAAHRAASYEFREAEANACAGLSGDDRDVSAFFHRDDIVDVQPLRAAGGPWLGRVEGAVVTFRHIEGLTPRRLQRLLDCELARDAALDYAAPEQRWSPLDVRGVFARVTVEERGLDARLAASGDEAAAETYLRASALLEGR